jgi:hypothetical protein
LLELRIGEAGLSLQSGGTALEDRGRIGITHLEGGLGGDLEHGHGPLPIAALELLFGDLGLAIFGEGKNVRFDGGIELGAIVRVGVDVERDFGPREVHLAGGGIIVADLDAGNFG